MVSGTVGLRTGIALVGLLAVLGAGAPWIASDRPWIARSSSGLLFPAWSEHPDKGGDPDSGPDEIILGAPVPHDPNRIDLDRVLNPPSRLHLLGTDGLGRDLAARIVHGASVSLTVGLLSAFLALAVGIPLGGLAGYLGGFTDRVVSRCIETILCFPTLLLLLALLATAPGWLRDLPDVMKIAVVLGGTGWVPVARYLRGEFMRLRSSDVVSSARAAGAGHVRVAIRHILPAAMAPVLVTASFAVAGAIMLEAALSFLGLGVSPPTATWGGMLTEAATHVRRAWWLALFPGMALFAALLGCTMIGEGLRDLLDPRSR